MTKYLLLKKIIFFPFTFIFIFLFADVINPQVYLDSTADVESRIEDLLSRMNLDEKIGQMAQAERSAVTGNSDITTYFLGSILSGGGSVPGGNNAESWINMYETFQTQALDTRLKIPIIYGIDAVHGHNNVRNAVIFPHNIGLGCARDSELVRQAASITAKEIMGTGLNWTFAPCIAVPQNERWGRTYEGFSESPELVSQLGAASVLGFQGDSLMGKSSIVACAKHYVGDGGTTGGYDQGNTEVDEETLRRIHLPGYIAAINAGVGTVMASFSSWNGSKLHGNKYLITDVLKNELGFAGFVVSDWAAIDQLPGTYSNKVEVSINAGIDMVMLPYNYETFISTVKTLVSQGLILQSRIDDAVRRILRIKLKAGLFEHPYADRTYSDRIGSDAHRLVARECVRKSLVLLKKKDNVLPLSKNNIKIHVAGKNADDIGNQCGGWTISWQGSSGNITEGTTVLEAIQNAVETSTVTYSLDGSGAAEADFAVAVIGETPYAEGDGDRDDLNLTSSDINTVRNLKKEGVPVIVIIISGRPMIIEPILHYSDAIIAAWLPGTEGDGIADILFGNYQPSGLLSYTWPQNMEQIPINFGDSEYSPLYAFGYGLKDLNNSAAGSSPEFSSALAVPDDSQIEVTFNKSMTDPSADYSGFIVSINSSSTSIITNAALKEEDNTTIILSLDQIIEAGDVVKISYNPGNIQSLDSGMLNSFSEKSVYVYANEIEYFTIPGKIEAEDYYAMSGIDTENTSDAGGGLNVGWIDSGDWMEYFLSIPSNGTFKVDFRIASLSEAGQITLKLDDETISTISLPVTGGWQNWQTVSVNCTLTAGIKAFRIIASEGGFNINWFDINISTSIIHEGEILSEYMLLQNYPNPFNPSTTIKFNIPEFTSVKLAVYDLLGREITVLVDEPLQAGSYNIKFNLEALNLSSGIYLYKLQAGSFSDSKKFVLIK